MCALVFCYNCIIVCPHQFPFLFFSFGGESAHMATGILDSIVQGAICLKEVMPPMLRFLLPLL
jgi:hypothetical protein